MNSSAHTQTEMELTAFYDAYIDTFNHRRLEEVPRFFAFPWVTVDQAGDVHTIPDTSIQIPMWAKIVAELEGQGWSHSVVDRLDIHPTGMDTALLAVNFTRWRKTQTIIERRRGFYVVRRFDDGWKIVTSWDARTSAGS